MVIASIPSPSTDLIELGPFQLRFYGLSIALGVLAAVWLASKRNVERGGHPDDMSSIAMWAVPAGLIGARLYHVATDWRSFHDQGRWGDFYKIWQGGLGIPGGMALGVVVGMWAAHRRGLSVSKCLDICAPALPLAQAIGRWGNWFNQELYGRPSDAPWAVEIDADLVARQTPQYIGETTFHPTFLYESLWNFALVAFLLWFDRKKALKPGRLIWMYVLGYGLGRLWVELLRIDTASRVFGVRINVWMSLIAIVLALLVLSRSRATDADWPKDSDDLDDPDDFDEEIDAETDTDLEAADETDDADEASALADSETLLE